MARLSKKLPEYLRGQGLTVAEADGWQDRGGDNFTPTGIVCHATAGRLTPAQDIRVLVNGSTTAPPPIAQFLLDRDGVVHMVATGRCNHVGSSWRGNSATIGIEAANDNRNEAWPARQYAAYVRLVAALCKLYGWNPDSDVKGHKEVSSTGKTDPTFGMPAFRAAVRKDMATPTTPVDGGSNVASDDLYTRYLLLRYGVSNAADAGNPAKRQAPCLQTNHEMLVQLLTESAAQRAAITALAAAVAEGQGADPEAIKAAIRDGVQEALDGVQITLDMAGDDSQG